LSLIDDPEAIGCNEHAACLIDAARALSRGDCPFDAAQI